MASDQRTNPPSASEDGYDASRSTCSVTALYELSGGKEMKGMTHDRGETMGRESAAPWHGSGMDRGSVRRLI